MKKIWDFVVHVAKDKLLHIVMVAVVTSVAILVCKLLGCGKEACAYGWLAGFVVGFAKELYDENKSGTSESGDWLADLIGATSVAVYSLLIMA